MIRRRFGAVAGAVGSSLLGTVSLCRLAGVRFVALVLSSGAAVLFLLAGGIPAHLFSVWMIRAFAGGYAVLFALLVHSAGYNATAAIDFAPLPELERRLAGTAWSYAMARLAKHDPPRLARLLSSERLVLRPDLVAPFFTHKRREVREAALARLSRLL